MDRNKRSYSLRIDRTLLQKVRCIADSQCRSTNKEIERCLKKHVEQYESRYGEIPITALKKM